MATYPFFSGGDLSFIVEGEIWKLPGGFGV